MKLNEEKTIIIPNKAQVFTGLYQDLPYNLKIAMKKVQETDWKYDLTKIGKFKILENVQPRKIWDEYSKDKTLDELNVFGYEEEFKKKYSKEWTNLLMVFHKYLPDLTNEELVLGVENVMFKNAFGGYYIEEAIKADLNKNGVKTIDSDWEKDGKFGIDFYMDGKPVQVKTDNWFKKKNFVKLTQQTKYKNHLFIVYHKEYDNWSNKIAITYVLKTYNDVFENSGYFHNNYKFNHTWNKDGKYGMENK